MDRRQPILVVDDHEGIRRALRGQLVRMGYEVSIAHDRVSALHCARRAAVLQYAIVDQNLSGSPGDVSGIDLAQELLALHTSLRIVIYTAYSVPFAAFRAGRTGIVDYVEKPASVRILIASLQGQQSDGSPKPRCDISLARKEHDHAHRVLADCGGNLTRAAAMLGITRQRLARILAAPTPKR